MRPDLALTIIEVPCPDCGQMSPEPLERVVSNDVIPCSLCGGLIDLSADECKDVVTGARRLWEAKLE